MRFLLDTNVVSELSRNEPSALVLAWMSKVIETDFAISAISILEIRQGIDLLPQGKRRTSMDAWLTNSLVPRFRGRILPISHEIADRAGSYLASLRKGGFHPDAADAMIAAAGTVHDLTVVTRNVRHFEHLAVEILNPWQA